MVERGVIIRKFAAKIARNVGSATSSTCRRGRSLTPPGTRAGLIWNVMRRCPVVIVGLRRAGFTGGWL